MIYHVEVRQTGRGCKCVDAGKRKRRWGCVSATRRSSHQTEENLRMHGLLPVEEAQNEGREPHIYCIAGLKLVDSTSNNETFATKAAMSHDHYLCDQQNAMSIHCPCHPSISL
jgi:hypothetical protein